MGTRITVSFDRRKVEELMQSWNQGTPEALVEAMLDMMHRVYVDEKDELIPRKACDKLVGGATSKWAARVQVKRVMEQEKKYCPSCNRRVKYDAIREIWVCPRCDWEGADPDRRSDL